MYARRQHTLLFLCPVRFFLVDGTSADSFRDVDKTADEEFLFPRMSRDERKCRRAAIDPATAAPASNANQSASYHPHERTATLLRRANCAIKTVPISLNSCDCLLSLIKKQINKYIYTYCIYVRLIRYLSFSFFRIEIMRNYVT